MVVVIKHVTYSLVSLTFSQISQLTVTLVSVLPTTLLGIVSMCRAFALGALDAGL
jgi:hypothetical protein